jgi:hypothetical protein
VRFFGELFYEMEKVVPTQLCNQFRHFLLAGSFKKMTACLQGKWK